MDNSLTPEQENELIENALRSYPVAIMPRPVAPSVMARIPAAPSPRFRLTRTDVILAVFLTVVVSAIVFSLQFLPAYTILHLRIQAILLWQDFLVNARWLVPTLLFGLAAFLAALTLPALFQMVMDRGR